MLQIKTQLEYFRARPSMKCGVSRVPFVTYIDKPFFAHFGQFSKCLFDYRCSYFIEMTTEN